MIIVCSDLRISIIAVTRFLQMCSDWTIEDKFLHQSSKRFVCLGIAGYQRYWYEQI